jgi:hypothetical protein
MQENRVDRLESLKTKDDVTAAHWKKERDMEQENLKRVGHKAVR